MTPRTLLVAGTLVVAAAVSASAGVLTLDARAGLGGVTRAGRWTPVRVTIDNTGPDLAGVLVIAWGDAEVRRDISIASPARKQIQIYLRTSNVESSMKVRLISNGVEVRTVDAPVRLADPSATMTLCVQPDDTIDATGTSCDARVTPDMLPDAARGYDAFDRVIWSRGTQTLESGDRRAFRRWESLHALDDSGRLTGAPPLVRPVVPRGLPGDSRRTVALGAAFYLAALLAGGLVWGVRRGNTAGVYATIALIACLGSTMALALGRSGPATAVVVRHSTLLQQLADGNGSAVSMRALAEFPAFDAFAVRAGIDDAVIEPVGVSEKKVHVFDEPGDAVLAGTFGLGARQAFALEGFTRFEPLGVTGDGVRIRLTNRSAVTLRDCRFADGFSTREVGALQPGQTVGATQEAGEAPGPVFTCTVPELPFSFSEAGRPVEARGIVRVAAYWQPPTSAADSRETEP